MVNPSHDHMAGLETAILSMKMLSVSSLIFTNKIAIMIFHEVL